MLSRKRSSMLQNDSGQHLTVKASLPGGKHATILLTYPTVSTQVSPGDSISFMSTLNQPKPPDLYENDYAATLRRNGIEYTAFVRPNDSRRRSVKNGCYYNYRNHNGGRGK